MIEEKELFTCVSCGEESEETSVCSSCGQHTCENCEGGIVYCDRCNKCDHGVSSTFDEVSGDLWCQECIDRLSAVCGLCDKLYPSNDLHVCRYCDYLGCESCLEVHDCGEHDGNIREPGDWPKLVFHGEGPRYFGVELEIDRGGRDTDNAERFLELSRDKDLFWITEDGSLNDGLEIVTQPCSVPFMLNEFPWEKIRSEALGMGYSSHNSGTCGLHIHFSIESLHPNKDENLTKLILFFWRHWNKLAKLSRRTPSSLNSWARDNLGTVVGNFNIDKSPTGRDLVDARYGSKGTAINPCYDTIEIRLFRGSLNVESIRAAIQFLDVTLDIILSHDSDWVIMTNWDEVAEMYRNSGYKELVSYMERREVAPWTFSNKVQQEMEMVEAIG